MSNQSQSYASAVQSHLSNEEKDKLSSQGTDLNENESAASSTGLPARGEPLSNSTVFEEARDYAENPLESGRKNIRKAAVDHAAADFGTTSDYLHSSGRHDPGAIKKDF
jgi:hypothetical protein